MDSEHAVLHYVPDVDQYIIRDLGSSTGVCLCVCVCVRVCVVCVCACACVCVCARARVCMCVLCISSAVRYEKVHFNNEVLLIITLIHPFGFTYLEINFTNITIAKRVMFIDRKLKSYQIMVCNYYTAPGIWYPVL